MKSVELTPEQERFANHDGEAFVQACPGAGKTRTILARLARIGPSLPPRRGVAVLSYTNSAVEEFAERISECGLSRFLRLPGFVGTFDAFVPTFPRHACRRCC
jgi:DNA helicase-2/ATP-dependent DNA helicase PcrA